MIRELISRAIRKIVPNAPLVTFSDDEKKGHLNTNCAMIATRDLGLIPPEAAKKIKEGIENELKDVVEKIEIAGPGFLNFFLKDSTFVKGIEDLEKKIKKEFDYRRGEKMNIEFISANPTGELHIGHGRGAFYGDALANILEFSGANVTREYYINDSRESNQIEELGKTALGLGTTYLTDELKPLIAGLKKKPDTPADAGYGLSRLVQKKNQEFITKKLGIKFDEWYSEEENINASLLNERTFAALKMKGLTYEKEGAVWLKTREFGDDEDRVIMRSDHTPSYFLSDISYHADKFARGYDTVVNVWGADHHGHVKRLEAAKKMLGWKGNLKIFITQIVSLKHGEETAKMSKRAGNVVYLRDLVEEFGLDVVRWFYNEKSPGTHMEFDARLAKEHSEKNPVFYVQYAHARICSILKKAKGIPPDGTRLSDVIQEPSARHLAIELLKFEEMLETAANDFQVHRLTSYSYALASVFSRFYRDVRIVNADSYNKGAYQLLLATKSVLAKTLALLGISAPEKM